MVTLGVLCKCLIHKNKHVIQEWHMAGRSHRHRFRFQKIGFEGWYSKTTKNICIKGNLQEAKLFKFCKQIIAYKSYSSYTCLNVLYRKGQDSSDKQCSFSWDNYSRQDFILCRRHFLGTTNLLSLQRCSKTNFLNLMS